MLVRELREEVPLEQLLDLGLPFARGKLKVLEHTDQAHEALRPKQRQGAISLLINSS